MELRTVCAADVARERWANGQGWTRELARSPGTEWSWRLSLAESQGAAGFSALPGTERLLVLARGERLALDFEDGEDTVLDRVGAFARFSGARPVSGVPDAGGTEQLNLMWRPDDVRAEWSVVTGPAVVRRHALPGETLLWHVLDGRVRVGEIVAEAGCTVVGRDVTDLTWVRCAATGTAVAVTLAPQGRAG